MKSKATVVASQPGARCRGDPCPSPSRARHQGLARCLPIFSSVTPPADLRELDAACELWPTGATPRHADLAALRASLDTTAAALSREVARFVLCARLAAEDATGRSGLCDEATAASVGGALASQAALLVSVLQHMARRANEARTAGARCPGLALVRASCRAVLRVLVALVGCLINVDDSASPEGGLSSPSSASFARPSMRAVYASVAQVGIALETLGAVPRLPKTPAAPSSALS